jgi:hypothetical protein
MKAEWLEKGANSRFVLTNLDLPPQELYGVPYFAIFKLFLPKIAFLSCISSFNLRFSSAF